MKREQIIEEIRELPADSVETINRWLDRGDGVAVYQNEDLGHPEVGHLAFLSYGSSEAQLETSQPPERCPDGLMRASTGGINWRYRLVGVYRGDRIALL